LYLNNLNNIITANAKYDYQLAACATDNRTGYGLWHKAPKQVMQGIQDKRQRSLPTVRRCLLGSIHNEKETLEKD
jgi:hypothetical protein